MRFRPCIDIHNGKVKQIVGGSLKDLGDRAQENFVSEQDAAFYAKLYQKNSLKGEHYGIQYWLFHLWVHCLRDWTHHRVYMDKLSDCQEIFGRRASRGPFGRGWPFLFYGITSRLRRFCQQGLHHAESEERGLSSAELALRIVRKLNNIKEALL